MTPRELKKKQKSSSSASAKYKKTRSKKKSLKEEGTVRYAKALTVRNLEKEV